MRWASDHRVIESDHRVIGLVGAVVLALILPARAGAQAPVPDEGMFALGLSLGASFPSEDSLESGLMLGVSGEGYFTPRLSVRGQLSASWWDIEGHSFEGTVKPLAFTGNLVYNWERGAWHPYATGGIGIYRYGAEESDIDSSDTQVGLTFGGGIEYFFTREDTITGEVAVHVVPDEVQTALSEYKARYWTLSVGYKRYWR